MKPVFSLPLPRVGASAPSENRSALRIVDISGSDGRQAGALAGDMHLGWEVEMLNKRLIYAMTLGSAMAGISCASEPLSQSAPVGTGTLAAAGGRAGSEMVVYVTSQGLYYDTFVARDPLPMEGKFQLLDNGATEFGPGDPGYLGGRWWEDLNQNGVQDAADHYFLCPLLPPGRESP